MNTTPIKIPPPERRRHPDRYSEGELHEILVDDACRRIATPLPWAVKAYERIGGLSKMGQEAAYQRVLDDVESRTGMRMMPLA